MYFFLVFFIRVLFLGIETSFLNRRDMNLLRQIKLRFFFFTLKLKKKLNENLIQSIFCLSKQNFMGVKMPNLSIELIV